jgi:hypothetical protein
MTSASATCPGKDSTIFWLLQARSNAGVDCRYTERGLSFSGCRQGDLGGLGALESNGQIMSALLPQRGQRTLRRLLHPHLTRGG